MASFTVCRLTAAGTCREREAEKKQKKKQKKKDRVRERDTGKSRKNRKQADEGRARSGIWKIRCAPCSCIFSGQPVYNRINSEKNGSGNLYAPGGWRFIGP